MEIDIPKYFAISETELLFYNIINIHDKLILICPYNMKHKEEILIKYKNCFLKCKTVLYEPINPTTMVLLYDFHSHDDYNDIEIFYKSICKRFNICKKNNQESKTFALAVICDDHKFFELFYNYYTLQGVQHFYCYYINSPNDEAKDSLDKENVTLIEWDFSNTMFNLNTNHSVCMNDALYNYGKSYKYMGFCNMTNFFKCSDNILANLIKSNKDEYIFHNKWAELADENTEKNFPLKIKVDNINYEKNTNLRIRKIVKTSILSFISLADQNIYTINKPVTQKGQTNYNFYKWANKPRTDIITNTYILLNIFDDDIIDEPLKNPNTNQEEKLNSIRPPCISNRRHQIKIREQNCQDVHGSDVQESNNDSKEAPKVKRINRAPIILNATKILGENIYTNVRHGSNNIRIGRI